MMSEIVTNIINTTISSFDITFCIIANIATYLVINIIGNIKHKKLSTWNKRVVFIITAIVIAVFYCFTGSDYKTVFNSLILAPVSWSWIFKPICNKFNIDYNSKTK